MRVKRLHGIEWRTVGHTVGLTLGLTLGQAVAIACVVIGVGACGSNAAKASKSSSPFAPAPDPNAPPPADVVAAKSKPWTDRFLPPSMLVADEIHIEGPAPLLEHVVTRPEPAVHDSSVQTIPAGFEQTIRVRTAGAEIRAQIDQLSIVAMRKLVVLERPGAGDVLITAVGDVSYWKDGPKGQAARSQSLKIPGPIPR